MPRATIPIIRAKFAIDYPWPPWFVLLEKSTFIDTLREFGFVDEDPWVSFK